MSRGFRSGYVRALGGALAAFAAGAVLAGVMPYVVRGLAAVHVALARVLPADSEDVRRAPRPVVLTLCLTDFGS